jgi:hypothetical protein
MCWGRPEAEASYSLPSIFKRGNSLMMPFLVSWERSLWGRTVRLRFYADAISPRSDSTIKKSHESLCVEPVAHHWRHD